MTKISFFFEINFGTSAGTTKNNPLAQIKLHIINLKTTNENNNFKFLYNAWASSALIVPVMNQSSR